MRWGPARFRRDRFGQLRPERRHDHTSPAHEHTPPACGHTPLSVGRGPATPALCYSTSSRHWWLWWPCPDCGGVRLPLRGSAGGRAPVYVIRAAAAAERCPGCETRRRRSQAAGPEPTVWYDTQVRDWVV